VLTAARTTPRPVAIGRILLATGALLTCQESAELLTTLQGGRITTPVATALPGATSVPVDLWFSTMVAACILLALGVLTPACTAVIASGNVALMAVDLQLYSNHRFLLVLLCLWFTWAQSDRALSVRARLRDGRAAQTVPWWPQLLVIASVSSCYLFAGLSKLNPEFLSGDLIARLGPAWLPAEPAAWMTVPTEIFIGVGLWWHVTRRWSLLVGVGLHVSISVLLGTPLIFLSFALLCFSAYPLVWSWPRLAQADAAATQRSSVP
jgi:hypothetical protein